MDNTLICIMGTTMSGKDSLARVLMENFGMKMVCSYTTRPKRPSETEGVEHYFRSEDEFKHIMGTENVLAYTKIEESGRGGYEYCATQKEIENSDIYIIDPRGLKCLKAKMASSGIRLVSFFIDCDYDIRLKRIKESSRGTDEYEKFIKRCENEKKQFEDCKNNHEYDYLITNNESFEKASAELLHLVKQLFK